MSPNFTEDAWLRCDTPCEPVEAYSDRVETKIWFKSKPVDKDFCYRVTQLQLCTDSKDQGYANEKQGGSWTWFELVILANENSDEPKKSKEGDELVWRSHSNRLANDVNPTRHFGAVFDRRSDLLANFEVGDVLAVRVCARFPGWVNFASRGYIVARVINEDLFTPHRWTLASEIVPKFSEDVEDGSYSFMSTTACNVKSDGNDLVSNMWFTTPALDKDTIDRFEAIQLFTYSRLQKNQTERVLEGDSFSWFDLVILDSPKDTVPRVENGVSLVWKSHHNDSSVIMPFGIQGRLYDVEDEEVPEFQRLAIAMKGALKAGNAIGVRVNAQYPGWENYARFGQLVVRISNAVPKAVPTVIPDVTDTDEGLAEVRQAMTEFYSELGYTSATLATLSNEARADMIFAPPPSYEESRPLRLLSCDGGGVRGVSPLRILKKIMQRVAELEGKPNIKPCEYFDMMVGTSTGGLIALMLGRLQMTIDECEKKYDEISQKVFGSKAGWVIRDESTAFATGSYLYDPKNLEDAIKKVVGDKLGDPLAPMLEENPKCKVLVMSALASKVEDANTAVHLRNYKTDESVPSEALGWQIWEAARATSAAPVYFPRFEKGGLEFVDGGLGWNNPSYELIAELPAIYGKHFTIGCLVSLGTGIPPEIKLGTGLTSVRDFIAIATNSEVPHNQLKRSATLFPLVNEPKYWRFNMSKKMSDEDWVEKIVNGWFGKYTEKLTYKDIMVKMDDWTAIEMIRQLTDKWLEHADVIKTIDSCAARIAMKDGKTF
ncbi:hypothetical protein NMY22_g5481 [Coprinellus aureogranulatus]|nr:hypothetical protein NMY22_g5481 [Coprinellus aureogranulatus]